MAYSILEAVSIIFIVLGLLLGVLAVILFRTKNMAEVYDALLNRGYVEKMERRRKSRDAKRSQNSSVAEASQVNQTLTNLQNTGAQVPQTANRSGSTTLLDVGSYNETGVLDDSVQTDFRIIKKLRYSFSKEVIS